MLKIITSPDTQSTPYKTPSLFLAGGITRCPDWQSLVCTKLRERQVENLCVFNPRREEFDITDQSATSQQIAWEWQRLKQADLISFWFCAKEIQPIALFELGRWSASIKPKLVFGAGGVVRVVTHRTQIVVGADPDYPRVVDVLEQMKLQEQRVHLDFNSFFEDLLEKVKYVTSPAYIDLELQ